MHPLVVNVIVFSHFLNVFWVLNVHASPAGALCLTWVDAIVFTLATKQWIRVQIRRVCRWWEVLLFVLCGAASPNPLLPCDLCSFYCEMKLNKIVSTVVQLCPSVGQVEADLQLNKLFSNNSVDTVWLLGLTVRQIES